MDLHVYRSVTVSLQIYMHIIIKPVCKRWRRWQTFGCHDYNAIMNAVSKIDGDITRCEYFHSVLLHVKAAECLSTLDGINYSGRVNTTESGLTCQRWDSQSPHGHRFTNPDDYPGDGDGLLHLIATIMLLGYSPCIRFIILYDIQLSVMCFRRHIRRRC